MRAGVYDDSPSIISLLELGLKRTRAQQEAREEDKHLFRGLASVGWNTPLSTLLSNIRLIRLILMFFVQVPKHFLSKRRNSRVVYFESFGMMLRWFNFCVSCRPLIKRYE